jgi:hypothetical protein
MKIEYCGLICDAMPKKSIGNMIVIDGGKASSPESLVVIVRKDIVQ